MESRDLHYLTAHNDISIILTGLQRSSLKCKREIGNKLYPAAGVVDWILYALRLELFTLRQSQVPPAWRIHQAKFRYFVIVMEYGLLGGLLCYVVKINRDYFSQTTTLVKYCRELHDALSLSPQTEVDEILVVAENALKAAGKRPRDKHIPGSHVEDCSCPDCSFEVAFACIRLAISKHTDLFDAKPLEKDLTVAKSRDKSDTSRLASVKVVLERERRKSKGPSSKTVYAAFEIQKRHENVLFRCGTIVSPVRCKSSDSFHALLWMLYRRGGRSSLRANTHFYRLQTSLLEKPGSSIAPLDMSLSLRDVQSHFKDEGGIDNPIRIQVLQDREVENHVWVKHQGTEFSPELPLLHFGNLWKLERYPTSLILKDITGYLWNATLSPPIISFTDHQYYEKWARFLPEMLKSKELDHVFWLPPIENVDPFQPPTSDTDTDWDSDDAAAASSQATLVELPESLVSGDVAKKQLATFVLPADAPLNTIEIPVAITPSVAATFSVVSCLQKEMPLDPQNTASNPFEDSNPFETVIEDTTPNPAALVMANKLSKSIESLSDSIDAGSVVIQQRNPLTATGVPAEYMEIRTDKLMYLSNSVGSETKLIQFVPDPIEETCQKMEKGQRSKKSWLHQGIQWVTSKLKR